MNNIKDRLDIFIITYNRCKKLDRTLSIFLSKNSPIKDFTIKIIDNNSSDDTSKVVDKYRTKFSNLLYEKNKYNIGGNANIVKAYYEANKDYVWVLADNDDYCWDSWNEVVQYVEQDVDAIMVSTYEYPRYNMAQFFIQTSFVPGMIYKTSILDDTAISNMLFNASNMFPHLVLSSKLINEHKTIPIVTKGIVIIGDNIEEDGSVIYQRGYDNKALHPLLTGMNWMSGYANSLHLIQDSKIRNFIIRHNKFHSPLNSAQIFFYRPREAQNNLYDKLCIFNVLNCRDKLLFLINFILYYSVYRVFYIFKRESFDKKKNRLKIAYYLRLFYFVKTKIFVFYKTLKKDQI